MKLENLIDYSACHCRIGKPKLIFHDPFCISFLPVRHAVAQRNLVFSFTDFVQLKIITVLEGKISNRAERIILNSYLYFL